MASYYSIGLASQLLCYLTGTDELAPGVPHLSLEDDIYNGMFIPKGSVVIANAGYVQRL
jgi:hypothetical protein